MFNCDPRDRGSLYYYPSDGLNLDPRRIMTSGLDSTLNYNRRSEFNVAFDPESGFNVTL